MKQSPFISYHYIIPIIDINFSLSKKATNVHVLMVQTVQIVAIVKRFSSWVANMDVRKNS